MAIRKLTNAAYLATNWQDEVESKNDLKKGLCVVDIDTTNKQVKAGSVIEANGVIYKCDANITPTNVGIVGTLVNILYFRDISGTLDFYFAQETPVFNKIKNGYYSMNNPTWRAVAMITVLTTGNWLTYNYYILNDKFSFSLTKTDNIIQKEVHSTASAGDNFYFNKNNNIKRIHLQNAIYTDSTNIAAGHDKLEGNNTNAIAFGTATDILLNTGAEVWTSYSCGAGQKEYAAYGNSIWVVIPNTNTTYWTSATGTSWTTRTLPASQTWSNIIFAGSYFFLFVSSSTTFYYSSDGISWTPSTLPIAWGMFGSVIKVGSNYVFSTGSTSSTTYYTNDLSSWTSVNFSDAFTSGGYIFKSDNIYYMFSYSTSTRTTPHLLYSMDCINWSSRIYFPELHQFEIPVKVYEVSQFYSYRIITNQGSILNPIFQVNK